MAEIERWITTEEGNHLPIIDGKIASPKEGAFLDGLIDDKDKEEKYELTSTAKYVQERMGDKNSWKDPYGNYYYLEDGNVYMEKSFYMSTYKTDKGWEEMQNSPAGVTKYIAPGSKDYAKIKNENAAKAKKEMSEAMATGNKYVSSWKDKGYGGSNIKPYELYKLAKNEYGLKMTYPEFSRKGVTGIMNELRDNNEATTALKKFFNPKVDKKGKLYFDSYND